MKNNKKIAGFTLIEIIGVLVIVSLLSVIIIPTMTNLFTESKDDMYKQQIEQIELAASNWGSDNLINMPILNNNEFSITLETLKSGGYIEQELINPDTNECFSNDMIIKITKFDGAYEYEFIEDSGSSEAICTIANSSSPIIYLLGLYETNVEINTKYEDAGVQALTSNLEQTTDVDVTITSDTGYDHINTQKLGTYMIEYTVEDSGISTSIKRIVNVVDTTAPVLVVDKNSNNYSTTEEFNSSKTFTNYGYTISDNTEFTGSIYASSLKVNVVSTVLLNTEGTYNITYTATDYSGNESKIVVTVTVNDTIAPTLSLIPTSVSITEGTTYATTNITTTSTDINGSGIESIKFYNGGTELFNFNTLVAGTYDISVIATDNAGNTTTVVLPVTIKSSTLELATGSLLTSDSLTICRGLYGITSDDNIAATDIAYDVTDFNTLTINFTKAYSYPNSTTTVKFYSGISTSQTSSSFNKYISTSITGTRQYDGSYYGDQSGTISVDVSDYTGYYYIKFRLYVSGLNENSSHTGCIVLTGITLS